MLKFSAIMVVFIFTLGFLPLARTAESDGSEYHSGICQERLLSHDKSPPKGVSKQEWDRNDDFLGPSHSGMERHFLWQ